MGLGNIEAIKKYIHDLKISKNANQSKRLRIELQLTGNCNLRCKYCYESKQNIKLTESDIDDFVYHLFLMDTEYWKDFNLSSNIEFLQIHLFGGEPLLEIKLIRRFFAKLKEYWQSGKYNLLSKDAVIYIIVDTNGLLLDRPDVREFLTEWKQNVEVAISIDGIKESHDANRVYPDGRGSFDDVMKQVKLLRDAYPDIKITARGTTTPNNVKYLYDNYKFYKDNNIPDFRAPLVLGLGSYWTEENVKEFEENLTKIREDALATNYNLPDLIKRVRYGDPLRQCTGVCGLNGTAIALCPSGFYTCMQFSKITIGNSPDREDLSIGNAHTGIDSEKYNKSREIIANFYNDNFFNKNIKCYSCIKSIQCEICPAFAYKETGTGTPILKSDIECKMEKVLYHNMLVYEYKLAKQKEARNHE